MNEWMNVLLKWDSYIGMVNMQKWINYKLRKDQRVWDNTPQSGLKPSLTDRQTEWMPMANNRYKRIITKKNNSAYNQNPCTVVVILIDRIELCTVKTINQTEKALNKQRVCISFPSS